MVLEQWLLKTYDWSESKFTFLTRRKGGYVTFGDNGKGRIIGHGSIGNNSSSLIENVLLVDGLKHNLLSISQLCDKGFKVILNLLIVSSRILKMIKSSSRAIEMKMFILLIFQNMKVIIDVFLACMMRVGCGIGD